MTHNTVITSDQSGGILLRVKVVPGSRGDSIAGMLGERLKIRVAAPAEDGRANTAVCALLAAALGAPARSVKIAQGFAHPEKTVRIAGMSAADAASKLGLPP